MAKIILSEQQFKDYMRILRENEKKKSLVNKIIKESMEEGGLANYLNDVSDNIRYGYSMGDGEPKDWKDAVARCGYDLISVSKIGFDCIPRYGFMGNADAIDEPEDVANMLTKFGIKAKYMGTFKTLNGQDVEKFKFIKGPVRESIEEAGGTNVDEYVNAVLNNEELLDTAIRCLSPRFTLYPNGTVSQQARWRIDTFISEAPEIFKAVMSIPKRKKIAAAIYDALRMKYRQYF